MIEEGNVFDISTEKAILPKQLNIENSFLKDFFISYNSADKAWAEWIAWQLEEARFSVILQAWDFRPGENFVLKMQVVSEKAERIIAGTVRSAGIKII